MGERCDSCDGRMEEDAMINDHILEGDSKIIKCCLRRRISGEKYCNDEYKREPKRGLIENKG